MIYEREGNAVRKWDLRESAGVNSHVGGVHQIFLQPCNDADLELRSPDFKSQDYAEGVFTLWLIKINSDHLATVVLFG